MSRQHRPAEILCLLLTIIFSLLWPPFAGARDPWPTYQANPAHTGYIPVSLDPGKFALRWQTKLASIGLSPVTAAGSFVFVSGYISGGGRLSVLDSGSGNTLWSQDFPGVTSANPPSYDNGKVYIQTGYADNFPTTTPPYLNAYDAATGTVVFASEFESRADYSYAPAIYNGKVYVNGGSIYCFDGSTGRQEFYFNLPLYDWWTPAVDSNLAYAYIGGDDDGYYSAGVYAVDRVTGQQIFQIPDPNSCWNALSPVLGGSSDLFAINCGRLIRFDLNALSISWVNKLNFTGQPTVANGVVYAINAGALGAYDQVTGASLWTWTPPSGQILQDTIVATNSHLFVRSAANTYCIDPNSQTEVWSYPAAGYLALGESTLYIAGSDGTLTAIGMGLPDIYVEESIVFSRTDLGNTSVQNVDVSNDGDAPLQVLSISTSGSEFGVQTPTLPLTLGPRQSITIEVSFTPTPTGTKTGILVVNTDYAGEPQVSAALSGTSNGTHTISAAAGVGGHITPSGSIQVIDGDSLSLSITPDPGYQISGVTVDGATDGTVNSYVFNFVTGDHSITAAFVPAPYHAINVPGDYPTIQAAIAAAADGDWVLVAPGTYNECIDFLGKGITVAGSGRPQATIINGGVNCAQVTISNCGQKQCALRGFTVANGIFVSECSPRITGNILTGAMPGSYLDAAVYVFDSGSPVIEKNIFNQSGCIDIDSSISSPKITGNLIENTSCDAVKFDSSIGANVEITNNTIVGNQSGVVLSEGVVDPGLTSIKNNIIVGNHQGFDIGDYGLPPDGVIENNLVYGNTFSYSGISDQTGINGNISADPIFLDPANNDYHLYSGSPAIGAGNASSIYLPATDLDGNPRDINGKLDMGAYEIDPNKPYIFYTVTASAGAGGTISPQGPHRVTPGGSVTFTVTPDVSHQLTGLLVDGVNVAAPSATPLNYTLGNVQSDHTVSAVFASYYDYFGMRDGNSSQYSVKNSNGSTNTENMAVSLDTGTFATPSYSFQNSFPDGSYAEVWYHESPKGLLWMQTMETDGAIETLNPPLPIIKTPLAAGMTWTAASTFSEGGGSKRATYTATVYPREILRVPAGYFLAWPIRYNVTFQSSFWVPPDTFTHWFAPFIGVVQDRDRCCTTQLTSFAVAGGTVTVPPPVVTGTVPKSGMCGSELTINGFQFGTSQGTSNVMIGGFQCPVISWSDNQIQCAVPATVPSGAGAVTVVTDTWTSNDTVEFTVLNPPQAASLNPTSGKRGSTVQISGANFGTSVGKVLLGKVQAKVTAWTDNSITFTVPAGMPPYGTYTVTVVNSQGRSSAGNFQVTKN